MSYERWAALSRELRAMSLKRILPLLITAFIIHPTHHWSFNRKGFALIRDSKYPVEKTEPEEQETKNHKQETSHVSAQPSRPLR